MDRTEYVVLNDGTTFASIGGTFIVVPTVTNEQLGEGILTEIEDGRITDLVDAISEGKVPGEIVKIETLMEARSLIRQMQDKEVAPFNFITTFARLMGLDI